MTSRRTRCEVHLLAAIFLLVVCAWTAAAQTPSTQHLLYAVDKDAPSILYVYDLDNSFALVKQVNIPTTYTGIDVRGLVVDAASGMMYISHGCYYQAGSTACHGLGGYLAKYNILTNQLLWDKSYSFSIDSHSITPDGKIIYMPTGENSGSSLWEIIDTSTGNVLGAIDSGQVGAHNTIVSNDGTHVYMGSVQGGYLVEASTANQTILQKIGPTFSTSVRPFTINSTQTLSFTTSTNLLGFQVGNILTGAILYTVQVGGSFAGACAAHPGKPCSHGITLSPDDREIYVTDIYNNYMHVYDVSGLPGTAPTLLADIPLAHSFATTGWSTHTRDGRFVLVGGSGDVINTTTRQIVGYIPALSQTEKFAEVDFQNGVPFFAPLSRSGVGYGSQTSSVSLSSTSLSFGNQTVGTTSSAQAVTLTNHGGSALSITSIAVTGTDSGDFSETNTCGSSVAAGASCTIHVTFTPTATGTRTASVTITDSDPSSPQTVSLTGTGVGAAPAASLSPTSLTFGSQAVGTTSAAQPVTLSNTGNAPLTITALTASGDFAQTNTCGSSLAAGGSCTINVTFQPTAAGTRTGTLSVTDNASGSPQTVALSGTGSAPTSGNFSLSSSSSSVAVTAGQTASFTMSVTPSGGFNQAVSLACTGAPQAANCTITPSSVTPSGTAAATATVMLTTTAHSALGPGWEGWRITPALWQGLEIIFLGVFLGLLGIIGELWKQKRPLEPLLAIMLLILVLAGVGCAGLSSSTTGSTGTPPGIYTLTLSGTSGTGANTITHSTMVTLTVN